MIPLTLIAAIGLGREIGRQGKLPWHIPADLRHFRQLTKGRVIIIGRKTYETIPPLPGRQIIVVSRSHLHTPGALHASSIAEALELSERLTASGEVAPRAMLAGGSSLYEAGMDMCDQLELTIVKAHFPDADAWMPEIRGQWQTTSIKEIPVGPGNKYPLTFLSQSRKSQD